MKVAKLSVGAILVTFSCIWSVAQGDGLYMDDESKYNSITLPSSYDFYMLTTTTKGPFDYHLRSSNKAFKLVIDTNPLPPTTTTKPSTDSDENRKEEVDVEVGDMTDAEVQRAVDKMLTSVEKDGTLKEDRFTHIRPLFRELTPVYNSMRAILRDKERAKIMATRLRDRFRERRRRLLLSRRMQHPKTPVVSPHVSKTPVVSSRASKTPVVSSRASKKSILRSWFSKILKQNPK